MRLALVFPYWAYPDVAEEYLNNVAGAGREVCAFVWDGGSPRQKRNPDTNNQVRIYRMPGINLTSHFGTFLTYPWLIGLAGTIAKIEPHIVDCQSPLFLTTIEGIMAARDLGIPAVVTVHGVVAGRNWLLNSAQYAYVATLGAWVFRNATLVRCLTVSDAKVIARLGCPQGKIRLVPNGVDTKLFTPSPDYAGAPIVGWVGRFVAEKGLEYLVAAAKSVVEHEDSVRFVLVGEGPLWQGIHALIRENGLDSHFILTGKLGREAVADFLRRVAVFVLPSVKEGMPLALLEAMASGRAVIGSKIPGVCDVISDGEDGILVPPQDPQALSEAITSLLKDEELRLSLGKRARSLMVQRYDWSLISSQLDEFYKESIGIQSK